MVKRLRTTSALAVVVMMLVSACGSSSASPSRIRRGQRAAPAELRRRRAAPAASAPRRPRRPRRLRRHCNLPAVPTGYTELDTALTRAPTARPFAGKKVSIQTQWTGGEGRRLRSRDQGLPAATGIEVQVDSIGSSHETVLKTRDRGRQAAGHGAARPADRRARVRQQGQGQGHRASFMDAAKLKAEFPSTIGLTSRGRQDLEHPDQGRRQVDDLVPGRRPSRPRATRFPRHGTSWSPWPTRSSPTAAIRSASAPAAPARRRAGS